MVRSPGHSGLATSSAEKRLTGKRSLTLAVDDTLYDFFQAHHVDELAVGRTGQEVKQGSRRFRGRNLQEGLFQLFAKSQFGGSLGVGGIGHGTGAGQG